MITKLIRIFTNILYLVPWKINRFQKDHPDVKVAAAGATKARKVKGESGIQYERGWITAKRGTLILAEDGLHCGNWFIPLAEIQEAQLLQFSGGLVLKISTTENEHFQFGLQYDPDWENQDVLPMAVEKAKIKYSPFSLIFRFLAIAVIIWFIYLDFSQGEVGLDTYILTLFVIWFLVRMFRELTGAPRG